MRTLTQPVHVAVARDHGGVWGVELAPPGVPAVLVAVADGHGLADAIAEAAREACRLNDPAGGDRDAEGLAEHARSAR